MLQEQPEEEPEPTPLSLQDLPVVIHENIATLLPDRDWGNLSTTCWLYNNLLSIELSVKAWQHQFPDLADWTHKPFQR
jgi:hypothetical protein